MPDSQPPNHSQFQGQTILCVDYGTKVTGLAIFTPGRDPYPLGHGKILMEHLGNKMPFEHFAQNLLQIIQDEDVNIVVLGLPLYPDGNKSKMTESVEALEKKLLQFFQLHNRSIQIFFQDETFSTDEAKRRMEQSAEYNFQFDPKKVDTLAAIIILEDFMNSPLQKKI